MVGNLNITTATMWMSLAFLILVVLHNVASEESSNTNLTAPEAKYAGRGYGYDNYGGGGRDHGYSGNNGYGQRQGHSGGGGGGYGHSRGHEQNRHVPIKIPYIDRNGCRFPGDVVCDATSTADPVATYAACVLSDESNNLWKKPTMTVVVVTCTGTAVLVDFCNDNERVLKAAGLIQEKKRPQVYYHLEKYAVQLNPCILVAPAVAAAPA